MSIRDPTIVTEDHPWQKSYDIWSAGNRISVSPFSPNNPRLWVGLSPFAISLSNQGWNCGSLTIHGRVPRVHHVTTICRVFSVYITSLSKEFTTSLYFWKYLDFKCPQIHFHPRRPLTLSKEFESFPRKTTEKLEFLATQVPRIILDNHCPNWIEIHRLHKLWKTYKIWIDIKYQ